MAPEQARGEPVDARADVFALGATLAAILTGQPAFVGSTAVETIQKAAAADLSDVLTRLGVCGADADLIAVAKRCLSADRDSRPADGRAVATEVAAYRAGVEARLRQAETERAEAVVREGEQHKRRRLFNLAAGVVAGVLTLGVIGTGIGFLVAVDRAGREEKAKLAEGRAKAAAIDDRDKQKKAYSKTAEVLEAMVSEVTGDSLTTQKEITPEQRKFLAEVLTYYQEFAESGENDVEGRRRAAMASLHVGIIQSRLGQTARAVAAFQQASAAFADLAVTDPSEPSHIQNLSATHTNLGRLFLDLRRLTDAETECSAAIEIDRRLVAEFPTRAPFRAQLAAGLLNMGLVQKDLGRPTEALARWRETADIETALVTDFPRVVSYREGLSKTRNNLGGLLAGLNRFQEATREFDLALSLREELVRQHPDNPEYRSGLAKSHSNLGRLLDDTKDGGGAEKHYQQAAAQLRRLVAEYPVAPKYRQQLGVCLNALAQVLRRRENRAEAAELYRQAAAVQEKLVADHPLVPDYRHELAMTHHNLGKLAEGSGKSAEAEEWYAKAIALQEKLIAEAPTVPDYLRQLTVSYFSLGSLYATDRPADAERIFRRAEPHLEKMATATPPDGGSAERLTKCRRSLGEALLDRNKPVEAEKVLRGALIASEQIPPDVSSGSELRYESAYIRLLLGKACEANKDLPRAATEYSTAATTLEKLVGEVPKSLKYRRNLCVSLSSLAYVESTLKRWPEAETHYRSTIRLMAQLAADMPDEVTLRVSHGGAYCDLGNMLRRQGKPSDSLEAFRTAIEILDRVVSAKPKDGEARQFLRNSYWGRARAYHRLKRYADAVADWDVAIKLTPPGERSDLRAERVVSLLFGGRGVEAVGEVDVLRKESEWDAEDWYNFACVYSVAAAQSGAKNKPYADDAMDMLRNSVKAGYKNVANVKNDKDLDPIRERDDFKKLLAELEQKFPPMLEVLPPPRAEK